MSKSYNVVLNCTAGILPGFPFNFVVQPGISSLFRFFAISRIRFFVSLFMCSYEYFLIGAVSLLESTVGYPPASFEVSDIDSVFLVIVLRDQYLFYCC